MLHVKESRGLIIDLIENVPGHQPLQQRYLEILLGIKDAGVAETARQFKVPIKTVYTVYGRYKDHGITYLAINHKVGNKKEKTLTKKEEADFIRRAKQGFDTQNDVVHYIYIRFGKRFSLNHCRLLLLRLGAVKENGRWLVK